MAENIQPSGPARDAPLHVLLVSDRPEVIQRQGHWMSQAGYRMTAVSSADALDRLRGEAPSLVVLDIGLAVASGLDLLRMARAEAAETAVVVMSRDGALGPAVEAMKAGAFDYLVEPFDGARLIGVLRKAAPGLSPREEDAAGEAQRRAIFQGFVGGSPAMREVYAAIEKAAASREAVFITGDSGTGKEVCAHAIHACGPRRDTPFIAIHCAAIPRDMMESEIFGHVRGAFAGAVADRTGAASQAHGGTLFLDEIGELSADLQAKVLRLIQHGTFQRLGGSREERVDIRIVCATSRDPREEVREGRLREDLFHRLHAVLIHLPPLGERGGDIMRIARHLLRDLALEEGKPFKGLTAEAEARIRDHPWPGNARALQNALYQAIALNTGDLVDEGMLAPSLGGGATGEKGGEERAPRAMTVDDIKPLWLVEQEAIAQALEICGQNAQKAAAYLEVGVSTIYRKTAEYEAMRKQSKAG